MGEAGDGAGCGLPAIAEQPLSYHVVADRGLGLALAGLPANDLKEHALETGVRLLEPRHTAKEEVRCLAAILA